MADFAGQQSLSSFLDDQLVTGLGRHVLSGFQGGAAQWQAPKPETFIEAIQWNIPGKGVFALNTSPAPRVTSNFAADELPTGPETDWFDHVYVLPPTISAGIVLAVKIFTITIYNSYKTQQRFLNTFTNNVDSGVVITDLPGLPKTIEEQDGFDLSLEVRPIGPAFISGTLDFTFDVRTVSIPVTGQRTIVLSNEPLAPLTEIVQFKTDIRKGRAGTEQRAALRQIPRSLWEMRFQVEGDERRQLESTIFDSQARVFGVPSWHESAILTAPISISDTVVTVDSTAFASFVNNGLAMAFDTYDNFEALQITSFTGTTITFSTPFTKPFAIGARILPIRLGFLRDESIRGVKFPQNLQELKMIFTSFDNDTDLSSTAAFNSFNSKVLLDDDNMIRGTLPESSQREIHVIDSVAGTFNVSTEWQVSRRTHSKTFFTRTRQRLWEVRQLLHALRGRQVSFYIPTFFPDLKATANVTSGQSTITVENVGYSKFVGARQARNVIRLLKTDGTSAVKTVLSALEIDTLTEQLTISGTWGINAVLADIDRVDFVEKVRFSSDDIKITHQNALGQATITGPVIAVLD